MAVSSEQESLAHWRIAHVISPGPMRSRSQLAVSLSSESKHPGAPHDWVYHDRPWERLRQDPDLVDEAAPIQPARGCERVLARPHHGLPDSLLELV